MIDKIRDTLSLQYLNNCGSCFSNSRLEKDQGKLNNKDKKEGGNIYSKENRKELVQKIIV